MSAAKKAAPAVKPTVTKAVAADPLRPLFSIVRGLIVAKGQDLSMRQIGVLLALDKPGLSVKHLADLFDIPRPSVTRACDALVTQGLVSRVTAKDDRRQVALTRTAAGNRVVTKMAVLGAS